MKYNEFFLKTFLGKIRSIIQLNEFFLKKNFDFFLKIFFRKDSFNYEIERIFPKNLFRKNSFNYIIERIFSKEKNWISAPRVGPEPSRLPRKTHIQNVSIDLRFCMYLGKRCVKTGLSIKFKMNLQMLRHIGKPIPKSF